MMAMEVGIGCLGFASRMIFFALEMAGGDHRHGNRPAVAVQHEPDERSAKHRAGSILYYLAAMLWLSLDMHHWMLVGLSADLRVSAGGRGASLGSFDDGHDHGAPARRFYRPAIGRADHGGVIHISLVFSVLGRAVPQMNVFHESFVIRILVGLSVFGLTLQLMSQHIVNYLRRLPEDVLQRGATFGGGLSRHIV